MSKYQKQKPIKLFGGKRKQLITSSLTATFILTMMLSGSVMTFAETPNNVNADGTLTVQSAATGKINFQKPKIGMGISILPINSQAAVYFGRYPQNSSKANDKSPIKWLTTAKEQKNNDSYNTFFTSKNSITVISEKVLDVTKWINFKKKWTILDRKWLVMYSKSNLFAFESTLAANAFNPIESASLATVNIVTMGGDAGPANRGGFLPNETTHNPVYSPYYVTDTDSTRILNDPGFVYNAQATTYALSKGLKNQKYGADYWFRKPLVGGNAPQCYDYISHIVKRGDISIGVYDSAKDQQLGVRPMTRIKGENLILVSQADQKANNFIVNDNIPSGTFAEYELTLLDSSRKFTAESHNQGQYGSNLVVSVTYTNAMIGANEYISYILTDINGNVLEYRRVKASDTASGAFNVSIPIVAMKDPVYKLNVFNEQITPGYFSDYASPISVIKINAH